MPTVDSVSDSDDEYQEKTGGDLLNMNWRSDPEEYSGGKWVRVDSVMDSGASSGSSALFAKGTPGIMFWSAVA